MSFSAYVLPVVVALIIIWGIVAHVPVFDLFLDGAKDGVVTAVRILGPIVGLMLGVKAFEASGALEVLSWAFAPVCNALGIPDALLPLAMLRPISGSGALAVLSNILTKHGPDSLVGYTSSVIMSSSETTFYTIAVYYGSVGIKKTRYTLVAALMADFTVFLAGCWIARVFFMP